MATTATGSDVPTYTCPQGHAVRAWPAPHKPWMRRMNRALCPECVVMEKERDAEQQAEATRQRQEAAWHALCPPLYRETDPDRLPADKLAEAMSWQWGPEGLLLIGPTGTGKTRCAYLLLKRLLKEGRVIRAFDCAAFSHECSRRFRDGTGEDWTDGLAKVEVVFLDDVGKMSFTERAETELFARVERRGANKLPIIGTTNMVGADIEAKASADRGAPLVRRLREFCGQVVFEGTRR